MRSLRRPSGATATSSRTTSDCDVSTQSSAKFIEHLEGDDVNLDARAVNGVKQISTELRMLDRHRREMLEADRRLMPRDEARRAFRTCDLLDSKDRRTMGLPDPCC